MEWINVFDTSYMFSLKERDEVLFQLVSNKNGDILFSAQDKRKYQIFEEMKQEGYLLTKNFTSDIFYVFFEDFLELINTIL